VSGVTVVRAGMLTTVQDRGRTRMRRHGIAVGGAMDDFAHRVANLLVRNPSDAATLECTIRGPVLRFADERVIAVTGFSPRVMLDGSDVAAATPLIAAAGSTLAVEDTGAGCRAYIAIGGGIDVPVVLGSRATHLQGAFGGLDGRALERGAVLPLGAPASRTAPLRVHAGRSILPAYSPAPVLRVMTAPESELLGADAWRALLATTWTVGAASNRMGCRLEGAAIENARSKEMISSPVAPGTVQLPPSGQPIILAADAQTVGGYPRIAHVAGVDLPLLAQVRPGGTVRFRAVSFDEARRALAARERDLRMLDDALRLLA
jgi:antagonist of KipI